MVFPDLHTERHFTNWLDSLYWRTPEEKEVARQAMLDDYVQQPEYYEDAGWPVLLRHTEARLGVHFWMEA